MMSAMVVTQTKLTYLVDTVNKIQLNVDINTKNRWTREDHKDYAKAKDQEAAERSRQVDSKIMRIEDRILKLEVQSASSFKILSSILIILLTRLASTTIQQHKQQNSGARILIRQQKLM